MGNGCHVMDAFHPDSEKAQTSNSALASSTRTLDVNMNITQSHLERFVDGSLGGRLGGVGRRFLGTLETETTRTRPNDGIAPHICNRHDGIVECRIDVDIPLVDDLFILFLGNLSQSSNLPYFFFLATVFRLPLRVRALVLVRCPRTGSPLRCLNPR